MSSTFYQELFASGQVVPDQLIRITGGTLVPRESLFASEAMWVAKEAATRAHNSTNPEVLAHAKYEAALAIPFAKWAAEQRALGRAEQELSQGAFWTECRHVAEAADDDRDITPVIMP
jgi:hypothetical protein